MKPKAIFFLGAILTLSAVFAASNAMADSKKWRANNHTDKNVKVYWTAAGCAGTEPQCGSGAENNLPYVCKVVKLKPGESASYKFKGGTSKRQKKVCVMNKNSEGARHHMNETSDRKKNGIRLTEGGSAEWYDD